MAWSSIAARMAGLLMRLGAWRALKPAFLAAADALRSGSAKYAATNACCLSVRSVMSCLSFQVTQQSPQRPLAPIDQDLVHRSVLRCLAGVEIEPGGGVCCFPRQQQAI